MVDAAGQGGQSALMAQLLAQSDPSDALVVAVSTPAGQPIACSDGSGGSNGSGSAGGSASPAGSVSASTLGGLFWGQDLRTAVAARFRVGLAAADWAMAADAANGDCPVSLAVTDADRYSAGAVLGAWQPPADPSSPTDPAWYLKTYPDAPPSRLLFSDLGRPVSAVLPGVHAPLQVTTAAGLTTLQAIDWLADAGANGGLA